MRFTRSLMLGALLPCAALAQTVGFGPGNTTPVLNPNVSARNSTVAAPTLVDPTLTDSGALLDTTRRIGAGSFVNGTTTFTPDGLPVTPGANVNLFTPATGGFGTGTTVTQANPDARDNTLGTPGLGSGFPGAVDPGLGVDPRITNAMSAGPLAISANATILLNTGEFGGGLPVLRNGSNGWTCITDNPRTPGNDPICADPQWLNWLTAYFEQRTPNVTGPGIAYMLQGGSEASLFLPLALQPVAGENWVSLPPHIRFLSPLAWDPSVYPTEPGLNLAAPWVLFPNTVYAHLIVPIPVR